MSASWVPGAEGSGYDIDHLPYGVALGEQGRPRLAVRIGSFVLPLGSLVEQGLLHPAGAGSSLNSLLGAAPATRAEVRAGIQALLADTRNQGVVEPLLEPADEARMGLPFRVADYVDFYSSEQHATNLGRMFRPDGDPLLPNWKHLPVGYHGRAGTVVVSGTPIRRPSGQRPGSDGPAFGPSQRLDIELEMGVVVCGASEVGEPVPIERAAEHIFGLVLVNDWSARDIQAWEYQPLGPFLGKSFATSIGAWVTPLAALAGARIAPPPQDPPVLEYLRTDDPWAFDIDLEVWLASEAMRTSGAEPVRVSSTNFRDMYWTAAQQLAHLTVNGAAVRPGDLYASGTISGEEPASRGSFIELTWNGAEPLELPDGTSRSFLEDGDEVVLRGRAGSVEMAPVAGVVVGG